MRAWVIALLLLSGCATRSPAMVVMAAEPGVLAPDSVEGAPGNPFATALIELLNDERLTLADFGGKLRARTAEISRGALTPEIARLAGDGTVRFGAPPPGESRVALVIIHARYTDGWPALAGALHDAGRVTAALKAAGFETRLLLDPGRAQRSAELAAFAQASANAHVALLYSTGHGIMHDGQAYLLDSDFAQGWREERLSDHALPILAMASALRARRANLLLFGGCRTYEWW